VSDAAFTLGDRSFRSRLIVGSGKYESLEQTLACTRESGAEMITVALRRVDLSAPKGENLLEALTEAGYVVLPNTAGCYNVEDALATARLGRELLGTDLVKLEVIGDPRTLYPDVEGTLAAARVLVAEGFVVLPYITDDPVSCQKLAAIGCPVVMPLAAPIGSGLGIRNPANLRIILETVDVPVIVDAGVGTASDAAVALELGCAAVLMNTAIAGAKDPVGMARAMKLAVEAGRLAFESGRIPRKLYATASSPLDGLASF
jgi:thiazole synthase